MEKNGVKKKKKKEEDPFEDLGGFDDLLQNSFKDLLDFFNFSEEDQFKNFTPNKKDDNNTRSYSISYKFSKGMNQPEIKVNGNPVDF